MRLSELLLTLMMKLSELLLILIVTTGQAVAVNRSADTEQIDTLQKVFIGGTEQWISIESQDVSNPVLLVLHGGPGYAMLPLFHNHVGFLENSFIVVNWDQRGAGRSYSSTIDPESMTLAQFVSDAHELTDYLKERFSRNKIYLLGHSFGTVLGVKLIQDYPDDYHAFGGVGQVVNMIENEQMSYDFVLAQSEKEGNARALTELRHAGRPDREGKYADPTGYDTTEKWVGYYSGELYGKTNSEVIESEILSSSVYEDHQGGVVAGWKFSRLLFDDNAVWELDFRQSAKVVKVPVYFFAGRHDYDTPSELVADYFEMISAPEKELIWFEHSAHFPFVEEPLKFGRVVVSRFLKTVR